MRRLIAAACVFVVVAGPGRAQEYDARIEALDVEVRSGPSTKYYASGKLRQGDRVRVKGAHGEYLAIEPPADSFSLVARQYLLTQSGGQGVVIDTADTLVGSLLVNDCNVKGTRLTRGTLVTILQEFNVDTVGGQKIAFCKIVPLNESRYILASALQKSGIVRAGGEQRSPPTAVGGLGGGVQPAGGVAPAPGDDQIGALLNRADLAYKRGQANGDWGEAKQLYEEINRSGNHEARMIALSRLSYIRRQKPQLFAGGPSAGVSSSSARVMPGASDRFGDRSTGQPPPNPLRQASGSTSDGGARLKPAGSGPVSFRSANLGRLRRAGTRDQGRPIYYLEDNQGKLMFYLAATTGLDLEALIDQQVEIQGGPVVYRHDLRGNYRVATSAKRVQ